MAGDWDLHEADSVLSQISDGRSRSQQSANEWVPG